MKKNMDQKNQDKMDIFIQQFKVYMTKRC